MNLEELRRLFCAKITLEYESIHEEMLSKEKEEIYDNAFYIDAVISIYECLLEMSQEMEQEGLKCLILFPNLLTFLYFRWMKKEDSYAEELEDCVKEEIIKMKAAGENVKGR